MSIWTGKILISMKRPYLAAREDTITHYPRQILPKYGLGRFRCWGSYHPYPPSIQAERLSETAKFLRVNLNDV